MSQFDLTKIKVWRRLKDYSDYDFQGSIDDAIAMLTKDRDESERNLRIEVESNRWEEGNHLELQFEDLETDEEFDKRIKKMNLDAEKRKEYDLKQLAMLKAKYEGNQ